RSESWPGWPLEVNKVFAVATRSYLIAKVREARKAKRLFHIKNTRIHQTYNGNNFQTRNSKMLRRAVEETKGQFLTFDNQPIVAMFDSCCGGVVPSKIMGVDFNKAPYLARDYACKYCKRCKLYRWKVEYSLEKWTNLLKKKFPRLKKLCGIKVLSRDDAGLIQELEIRGRKYSFSLTGKELYSLLDEVKSFYFSIRKKGKHIVLKGRGYGHHLGLCQWGAREMVRDGWEYKKILEFYYPDVSFVRLA
ncbi:SpoIID/LytB domain-containing protein, partial [bacterium]|nr:SpoIID/LytB domain-containing protein [bacterium]